MNDFPHITNVDGLEVAFKPHSYSNVLFYSDRLTDSSKFITTPIPKIFHFIWVGSPVPQFVCHMLNSWTQKHPDWEIHFWLDRAFNTEANIDFFLDICSTVHDLHSHNSEFNSVLSAKDICFAYQVDFLRLLILKEFGGIYVDCDMYCLNNIESLLYGCEAFTCISEKHVNNSIFGCNHEDIRVKYWLNDMHSSGAELKSYLPGPRAMTRCTPDQKFVRIYNQMTFYPLAPNSPQLPAVCKEIQQCGGPILDDLRKLSYAVHLWNFSWNKELNNGNGRLGDWGVWSF